MLHSRAGRAGVSLIALAVLAAAFWMLRPTDENTPTPTTTAPVEATTPATTSTTKASAPAPKPKPEYVRLSPDRVRKITVTKGETVRLQITSPTDEELHVHGFDHSRPLPAGKSVRMRFIASSTGIFEIELEYAGRQVAELTVKP